MGYDGKGQYYINDKNIQSFKNRDLWLYLLRKF